MQQTLWLGVEGQTWFEISISLFVEGLLLTLIFHLISKRSDKKTQEHLSKHMTEQTEVLKKEIEEAKNQTEGREQHAKNSY